MSFPIINLSENISLIIDLAISVIIFGLVIFTAIRNKLSARIVICYFGAIIIAAFATIVIDLPVLRWTTLIICFLFTIYVSIIMTDKEKQGLIIHHKKVSKKATVLTTNETDELIKSLNNAIEALSATKTGALITIERTDDLEEVMEKSGTEINAPVTPEIIQTIFYKGTLLHDGATIIRGNIIIKSAVFFQPTQRPLNGKYGSRHRAAIGISEICDAITIIVSEETGKVSIAYKGELTSVPVSNFEKKLKEFYYND